MDFLKMNSTLTCVDKNSLRFILRFIVCLFIMSFLIPTETFCQSAYRVKVQKLNVRSSPSTQSRVVGSLSKDEEIFVLKVKDGWATINYNGKSCFVSANHIEIKGNRNETSNSYKNTLQPSSADGYSEHSRIINTSSDSYGSYKKPSALWNFTVGGWMAKDVEDKSKFAWFLQLGGDFPISIGNKSFVLETGARLFNRDIFVEDEGTLYYGNSIFLEIPLRLSYDIPLAKDFDLRIGAGPYFSYLMNDPKGVHVGIEPSVVLKYKNFSLGLQYSLPLYEGYKNELKKFPMLTLGIRFKTKDWDKIAAGLSVVGTTATALANAINGNEGSLGSNDFGNIVSGNDEESSGNGEMSIDMAINEQKRLYNELARQLDNYNQRKESMKRTARTEYTRVNGKLVPITKVKPMKNTKRGPDNMAVDKQSAQIVQNQMNLRKKIIQHFEDMKLRGVKTISREKYKKVVSSYTKTDDENRKERLEEGKQLRKSITDTFMDSFD